MSARLFAAAFLLSILVPLGELLAPVALARGSLAALAILPWLALAPVPRSANGAGDPPWRAALSGGFVALPPLCLGAGVDLARGAGPAHLATVCAGAWLVLLLWTWAAESAARASGTRGVFAALWFVLLPGATALHVALAWVPRRAGGAPPDRARVLALDPLLWCHGWGQAGGLREPDQAELCVALVGALVVAGVVLALRRRRSAELGA